MTEGPKGGVNPTALAAALLAEADNFQPKKSAAFETLSNPEIFEAVMKMKDKKMSNDAIAEVLTKNGFSISGKTVRETLVKIAKHGGGDTDGKQEGKPKATKPRASAEARKEVKPDASSNGKGNQSGTGSDDGKSAEVTADAKPAAPASDTKQETSSTKHGAFRKA